MQDGSFYPMDVQGARPSEMINTRISFWSAMRAGRTLEGTQYHLKYLGYRAWVGKNSSGAIIAVICDGVSRARGPLMAEHLSTEVSRAVGTPPASLIEAAQKGWANARREAGNEVSASTITAVQIQGNKAHYIHVGDSRFYILRNGQLTQITKDHNEYSQRVQDLMTNQKLSLDAARNQADREGAKKNKLTKAIRTDYRRMTQPDIGKVRVFHGDVLLLVSDGIEKYIKDNHLKTALEATLNNHPQNPAVALVDMALTRGQALRKEQIDDISAVMLKLE
ncbi:hypothetical protein A3A46_00945 [Candidatus Roizmanbacteria bacterium RIFCSPLOWO2_01_FULL_37_13]|uniref:PPM-type phosphatase domain-containing protein n=1 Tax=Candidatus Roizmanbacteria bacterium RIFCSPHIGHO2_02_FULL_38_11 TaxID=1802039 RepID=A0A1F7H1C9_9BACT|nr:MAG: hypothetical protein A3C25_02755 [Candidatus Roizmanbacteria bacterium RIFCSPHIGHO2_02_FULL_38_11]OGK41254.1 MAG: hypothetical protein A3A46_00945 [Candidatus Roizmanbacteria bacterium RIFCSPLOWO2_01_FULL_37_13]